MHGRVFTTNDDACRLNPAVACELTAAAANGGGGVYFPRGRYPVCQTLEIPRSTVLRGEQRELVNLCWRGSIVTGGT